MPLAHAQYHGLFASLTGLKSRLIGANWSGHMSWGQSMQLISRPHVMLMIVPPLCGAQMAIRQIWTRKFMILTVAIENAARVLRLELLAIILAMWHYKLLFSLVRVTQIPISKYAHQAVVITEIGCDICLVKQRRRIGLLELWIMKQCPFQVSISFTTSMKIDTIMKAHLVAKS